MFKKMNRWFSDFKQYYKRFTFDVNSFIQAVIIFFIMNLISLVIGYYLKQLGSFDYLFFILNFSVVVAYYSYLYLASYKAYHGSNLFNFKLIVIPFFRGVSIFISYQFLLYLFYFSFFTSPMIVVSLGVLSVILYFLTGNIYYKVTNSFRAFYNQTGLIFMMIYGHLFGYLILPIKDELWSYYLGFFVLVFVVLLGGIIHLFDHTKNRFIKDGFVGKAVLFFGVIVFLVTTFIPVFRPKVNLFDSSITKENVINYAYETTFDDEVKKVVSYDSGYYVLTSSRVFWFENEIRVKELSISENQTLATTTTGIVLVTDDMTNNQLVLRFLEYEFTFIKEISIPRTYISNPVHVHEAGSAFYIFDDVPSAFNVNQIHYFDGTKFTTNKNELTDFYYKDKSVYLSVADGIMIGIIRFYQPFDQYEYRTNDGYYGSFYSMDINGKSYRYVHYNDEAFYYQLWLDNQLKITKKDALMSDYIELEAGIDPQVYVSDNTYFIYNVTGFYVVEDERTRTYEVKGNLYYTDQGFILIHQNSLKFAYYEDYNRVEKRSLENNTDYLIVIFGIVTICLYKKSWFE